MAVAVGVLLGVALVAVLALRWIDARWGDDPTGEPGADATAPDRDAEAEVAARSPAPSVAVVTTDGSTAVSIALLVHDPEARRGTVVLVPTGTLADVPGFGAHALGDAFRFGGGALVGVTLEHLLGVRVDAVAVLTPETWAAVPERFGPVDVEVVAAVPAADGRPAVPAGRGPLGGDELAAVALDRSADDELDRLPRTRGALLGLLEAIAAAAEPASSLRDLPGLELTVDAPEVVVAAARGLVEVRAGDELTVRTLPVTPVGTARDGAFRPDGARIGQLVDERLTAARLGGGAPPVTLQVLNGNGRPAVGATVAERLRPGNFRVVLTGNADRFDHEVTRILVGDDDPATVAAAHEVAERLGVGEVERAGSPQSVADLTVVVGRDLPETAGDEAGTR